VRWTGLCTSRARRGSHAEKQRPPLVCSCERSAGASVESAVPGALTPRASSWSGRVEHTHGIHWTGRASRTRDVDAPWTRRASAEAAAAGGVGGQRQLGAAMNTPGQRPWWQEERVFVAEILHVQDLLALGLCLESSFPLQVNTSSKLGLAQLGRVRAWTASCWHGRRGTSVEDRST
jgi:hypothetical protein